MRVRVVFTAQSEFRRTSTKNISDIICTNKLTVSLGTKSVSSLELRSQIDCPSAKPQVTAQTTPLNYILLV